MWWKANCRTERRPTIGVRGRGRGAVGDRRASFARLFRGPCRWFAGGRVYDRVLREVERPLFSLALEVSRGNQIKAAALLGLNRNTLRKKIRELDIEVVRGQNLLGQPVGGHRSK